MGAKEKADKVGIGSGVKMTGFGCVNFFVYQSHTSSLLNILKGLILTCCFRANYPLFGECVVMVALHVVQVADCQHSDVSRTSSGAANFDVFGLACPRLSRMMPQSCRYTPVISRPFWYSGVRRFLEMMTSIPDTGHAVMQELRRLSFNDIRHLRHQLIYPGEMPPAWEMLELVLKLIVLERALPLNPLKEVDNLSYRLRLQPSRAVPGKCLVYAVHYSVCNFVPGALKQGPIHVPRKRETACGTSRCLGCIRRDFRAGV
jgi:hypothetical protein